MVVCLSQPVKLQFTYRTDSTNQFIYESKWTLVANLKSFKALLSSQEWDRQRENNNTTCNVYSHACCQRGGI